MAFVKNALVSLIFAISVSRIFGEIAYNVVGNSNHLYDVERVERYPQFNSAREQFRNATLSRISSGVCVREVPTASLLRDQRYGVPRGNGSTPSMSRIQVCCEGYKRNAHILRRCDPICNQECVNGICVAPDQCQCYPDHVKNLVGYCVPQGAPSPSCPYGCLNGECNSNECICNRGYQLEPDQNVCVPICSPSCGHGGICTAPDVCNCKTGYQLAQGRCTPICEGGCEFGYCLTPGQCKCLTGYEMTYGRCEPICTSGCNNGRCAKPNVCECNPGWYLDETGENCVPGRSQGVGLNTRLNAELNVGPNPGWNDGSNAGSSDVSRRGCSRPCLNGVCTAAGTCRCNSGYVTDYYDPFKCMPYCPNGCRNGVCSLPNLCLCNLGFIKDHSVAGNQNCIPDV